MSRFKVVYRLEIEQEVEAADYIAATNAAAANATDAFCNGGCIVQLNDIVVTELPPLTSSPELNCPAVEIDF